MKGELYEFKSCMELIGHSVGRSVNHMDCSKNPIVQGSVLDYLTYTVEKWTLELLKK